MSQQLSPSMSPSHSFSRSMSKEESGSSSPTHSRTVTPSLTQCQSATTTFTTTTSWSSETTRTRSLHHSRTLSGTTDVTMTASETISATRSESLQHSNTESRSASISHTLTIQGFAAATAFVVTPIPKVRTPLTVGLSNAPQYTSGDRMFLVSRVFSSSPNATCPDMIFAQNSTYMVYIGSQEFQGSVLHGATTYDVCSYASRREQWSFLPLGVQPGPLVLGSTLTPMFHVKASPNFQLRIGVYGSTVNDAIILVPKVLSTATSPCPSPGSNAGIAVANSGRQRTNVSFSANISVVRSGDYAVCYLGYPYLSAYPVLSFFRIEGDIQSALLSAGYSIPAYTSFNVTVVGIGLSVFDQFMLVNGSDDCMSPRLPRAQYDHAVLTPHSTLTSLTQVVNQVRVHIASASIAVCAKSNFSGYYTAVAVFESTAVSASAVAPSNGTYASGSVVGFTFSSVTGGGVLNAAFDTAYLCNNYSEGSLCQE